MKNIVITMIAVAGCFGQLWSEDGLTISSVQYWFDDNPAAAIVSPTLELDADCGTLPPGLHTLHYRVADSNGRYSATQEHGFLKLDLPAAATKIETVQYWFDDMQANPISLPYTSEQFTIPTEALPFGLHCLHYRVKDDAGRWSGSQSHYFYRGETLPEAAITGYTYWWNDLTADAVTVTLDEPLQTFLLERELTVPENARTSYAGHYAATLNIVLTDTRRRSVLLTQNVKYPDNDAPATDIDADSYVASSSVKLTWTETSGDAMGDYNVYMSKDGEPFMLWLPDTKQTSATFKGEKGSIYLFTITGRDAAGNREKYDESKCVSVTFE